MSEPMTLEQWLAAAKFLAGYFDVAVRKGTLDPMAVAAWREGDRRSVMIGGQFVGCVSLPKPATAVRDKAALLRWAQKNLPTEVEEHTEERVRPGTVKQLVEQVKEHGGWINGSGEIVPVAGIATNAPGTHVDLEKDAGAVFWAAIESGEIDLGAICRPVPPVPEPVTVHVPVPQRPAEAEVAAVREALYRDEHGFLDPEAAAAHATLVQGGYSTPPIEAYRMIRDGGVGAGRALSWLAEQGLPRTDPREGKDVPWPLVKAEECP
jgi:hypothetical protein